jgi:hypothetical protein
MNAIPPPVYCRNKVVAAALLLFGLISTSRAGITITAPSVSEAPLYWSGTNCRIYVEAQATGNDSIGHFKLTLENGGLKMVYNPAYNLPADVKALGDATVKGIIDGSIKTGK